MFYVSCLFCVQPVAKEKETAEVRPIRCEPSPPMSPRSQQLEKMAAVIAAQGSQNEQRRLVYEAVGSGFDEGTVVDQTRWFVNQAVIKQMVCSSSGYRPDGL